MSARTTCVVDSHSVYNVGGSEQAIISSQRSSHAQEIANHHPSPTGSANDYVRDTVQVMDHHHHAVRAKVLSSLPMQALIAVQSSLARLF